MRYQRDKGLFGALIIRESQSNIHDRLGPFEGEPEKKTLALLERLENVDPSGQNPGPFCLPGGSDLPIQHERLSFFLNGKEIAKDVQGGRGKEKLTT
jgi:hypothetical protein